MNKFDSEEMIETIANYCKINLEVKRRRMRTHKQTQIDKIFKNMISVK